jgi:hypothetical protein
MKIELKKDLIQIRYDAAKVSPLEMVKTIARHGFEAKIVAGPSPAGGE